MQSLSVTHRHDQLHKKGGTTNGQTPQTCVNNSELGGSRGQKLQYWSAGFTPAPATMLPINAVILDKPCHRQNSLPATIDGAEMPGETQLGDLEITANWPALRAISASISSGVA